MTIGRSLLAVPLTSAAPPLEVQVAEAVRAGADLVELRVDCIGDVAEVEALLRAPRYVQFILTVRCAEEGGAWRGTEAERIALYERLARQGPAYIDIEHAAWVRSDELRRRIGPLCRRDAARRTSIGRSKSSKNRLVLSHHNLTETPADIEAVLSRLAADVWVIPKVVFTARDATDALRVLDALRFREGPVIALAMGEGGLATRVLAPKLGGFLTFAAPREGAESAPGQPTIDALRGLYRWDAIGPDTRVYGVLGWPVAHSHSPYVHNAALAAAKIAAVYLPLSVAPSYEDLAAFLDAVDARPWLDFAGFSVTIPHKEHALRWLDARGDQVSALARRCGAVNTLARRADGSWWGENTDAGGAIGALHAAGTLAVPGPSGRRAHVLGAGGVARAIVAALLESGCMVTVYNRTAARARRLAQQLCCSWGEWAQRGVSPGEILVNCTPLGMSPNREETPLPKEQLARGVIVFDTVYNPPQTRLLRDAQSAGCTIVSGREMFIHQAAAQFALWNGRTLPVDVFRQALPSAIPPAG